MGGTITQFFPPNPTFTDKNVESQKGRVFLVTGGTAGIGLETVKILYAKGGTVYIASRNVSKIDAVIKMIQAVPTNTSGGILKAIHLDLNDLNSVSKAASIFLAQESRLDVLFNNAGVGHVPGVTAQGYEIHMGTNCLAPYLLTQLLLPVLRQTAESSPSASVRVVFASSSIIDLQGPLGGISVEQLEPGKYGKVPADNYSISKAGNWMLASQFDRLLRKDGIVCVTQNPGNLNTAGWNGVPVLKFIFKPLLYGPEYGAYTMLWCGVSGDVKLNDGGKYAIPWGRWHPAPRKDILESLKTKNEGGTGVAKAFWEWCEKEAKEYI
jgi:NAD(P)-dependent dehydrogenase (short-subunit alcohol dehydrogenase family)